MYLMWWSIGGTVVYVGELLDSGCLELIHIWVVRAINGLGWGNNGWIR